jgi:hypothetical protein
MVRGVDAALVDSGDYEPAVMQFIAESGGRQFYASKGYGSRHAQSPFASLQKPRPDRIIGDHWLIAQQPTGAWLHLLDVDYWKGWVHDRLLTPTDKPGALTLFGSEPRDHLSIAKHLVSEEEREEFVPGKGLTKRWFRVNRNNHYFDAACMAAAMASIKGIKLLGPPVPPRPVARPLSQREDAPNWARRYRGKW